MENTERQKFEETWNEALDGAGVRPSEDLWEDIEQHLDVAEKSVLRKKVVYYQRLAAACVMFSVCAGAFGLYWRNEHQNQVTKLNSSTKKSGVKSNPQTYDQSEEVKIQNSRSETVKVVAKNDTPLGISSPLSVSKKGNNSLLQESKDIFSKSTLPDSNEPIVESSDFSETNASGTVKDSLTRLRRSHAFYAYVSEVSESASLFAISLKGGPRVIELQRKLPAMPSAFLDRSRSEKYGEKWWASAGASAGAYSPNIGSPSSTTSLTSSAISSVGPFNVPASSTTANYGSSYSVALTGARRISKRWLLQSGVQYMARSIDYTSNFVSNSGSKSSASLADYAAINGGAVTVTSPYQLESKSEYISIPLQAGYLLVDKRFGLLINSGVSSDIFIRNTLIDLSGQRSSYSESAGQNSPYRTLMWSALMSTELSYKMGTHYRLAIVPGMRYSFNQVLKSDQSTQGTPMIWDVGFRFRYIFK